MKRRLGWGGVLGVGAALLVPIAATISCDGLPPFCMPYGARDPVSDAQRARAEAICGPFGGVDSIEGCWRVEDPNCECSDGFSVERRCVRTCDEACVNHRGAAQISHSRHYPATAHCNDGSERPLTRGIWCEF